MKIGINVKLGVIAGLIICIAWYAFAKSLGFYAVEVYIYRNYVSLAVLILGIFLTVFLTRKSKNGFLEFSQGLRAGVVYSLVIALITITLTWCALKNMRPRCQIESDLRVRKHQSNLPLV